LNPDVEHIESPEKLSLKARLKLFEKEIEQQGAAPAPKPGKGPFTRAFCLIAMPKRNPKMHCKKRFFTKAVR
jgi:hypothetical protein